MNRIKGLAVLCDEDFNIIKTIRDDFKILSQQDKDLTLLKIVEKDSIDKTFKFMQEVKAHNAAFNWEINLNFQTHFETCYLTGVLEEKRIFVTATRELQDINNFFSQYQNIFYEQTKMLRSAVKDMPAEEDSATNIYDEFSRINNELTDLHRDISKKNVLLNKKQKHLALINRILRHDLANSFVVIGSAIRLFNRSKDQKYLETIVSNINKGIDLIRNMKQLEAVFIDTPELLPINILKTLKNVINNYPNLATTIQVPDVLVIADKGLEVILDNLIRNAIRHGRADKLTFQAEIDGENLRLKVSDNGTGIPDKIKDRIFEENFKAGNKGNTELGLYIVERMMYNYRGSVKVEDNKPKGAVFSLVFKLNKKE